MTTISLAVTIPAPLDEVWEELRHIDRHTTWMNDAVALTFLSEQREGVGTSFRCKTKVGPFVTDDIMRITTWVDQREMGVRHEGLITGEGAFVLEGHDGATTLRWTETLVFPWWAGAGLGAWFAAPILRVIWKKNLENFAAPWGHISPK